MMLSGLRLSAVMPAALNRLLSLWRNRALRPKSLEDAMTGLILVLILVFPGTSFAENKNMTITKTNHLVKEKSPYLLQHAYNPVNWYAWGPEAFQKAKAEHKPI